MQPRSILYRAKDFLSDLTIDVSASRQNCVIVKMSNIHASDSSRPTAKRRLISIFVIVFVTLRAIDSLPWGPRLIEPVKLPADPVMEQLGINTGPWMMFAPAPVVENGWMTAAIEVNGKSSREWMSPIWSEVNGFDKFRRFREVNFYNRLSLPRNLEAADDFAEYLRTTVAIDERPRSSVVLSAHALRVVPPTDGGVPARDELIRVLKTRVIATVEAAP